MRNEILDLLIRNAQQYVSGQAMCQTFGVTRAAIWKHIKALQAEGYEIVASTKKGYCLVGLPDRVSPALVSRGMYTESFGQNIVYEEVVDSTNRIAKKLADEGAPEGTLVLCERQSAGRGRLGRTWASPKTSGLYMSLILRPDLSADMSLPLTMMTALAVRDAIGEVAGMEAMIKWPNDILLNGKKVVGILTELSVDASGKVKWIVVGIGVNVNTHLDELPEEVRDTATSLAIERGLDCSRLELVRSICYQMETLYRDFLDQGADAQSFLPRYRIYSSTLARHVRMFAGTEEINGVAEDFDKDGALLIRTDDGALRRVFTGEVTSRPPQDAANEASAADAGGNAQ